MGLSWLPAEVGAAVFERLHTPLAPNVTGRTAVRGGPMSEYLVVTGMSGAGRSTAAATLEDLGWFVIDNMPSALIAKVSELVDGTGSEMERVAFVVGRGGGDLDDVLPAVDALDAGRNRVRILFLDAADDVLIRRFEGTRRRHPQAARGVVDSIADERRCSSADSGTGPTWSSTPASSTPTSSGPG